MDGFYQISFRGATDWGLGILVFANGKITGADVGGALYDGSYTVESESVRSQIKLTVPPGLTLVQGTPAQPTEYAIEFSALIPLANIRGSLPVLIHMPVGPVNVVFSKLRDVN